VPADGFFEWRAIKVQKAKQPYAIAIRDGKPFGSAVSGRTGGTWPAAIDRDVSYIGARHMRRRGCPVSQYSAAL
jgi:hypothetical protein